MITEGEPMNDHCVRHTKFKLWCSECRAARQRVRRGSERPVLAEGGEIDPVVAVMVAQQGAGSGGSTSEPVNSGNEQCSPTAADNQQSTVDSCRAEAAVATEAPSYPAGSFHSSPSPVAEFTPQPASAPAPSDYSSPPASAPAYSDFSSSPSVDTGGSF